MANKRLAKKQQNIHRLKKMLTQQKSMLNTQKRNLTPSNTDEPAKKKRSFQRVISSKISEDEQGHVPGQTTSCGDIKVIFEKENGSEDHVPASNAREEA